MARLTKSNNDNFLTWQKVNGGLALSRLQARGIPPCAAGYNISDLTYQQQIFAQSAAYGIFWSSDGFDLYHITQIVPGLYQSTVTTPFDISTVVSNKTHTILQDTMPIGFAFNNDGSKCYIAGNTNDAIYQYSLSTPWDVSTMSYDSVNFDTSSEATTPSGFHFSDTYFYLSGTGDTVYQYSWTPGDISTCVYVGSMTIVGTTLNDVFYYNEKIYITDVGNDMLFEVAIPKENINNAYIIDSVAITGSPRGVFFDEGGFNMWIVDSFEFIKEYWVGCP